MTKRTPLDPFGDISVAVVAYRTPEFLQACLQSIEEQRPRRVAEVIVVDNSADGSGDAVATRHQWATYIANPTNIHFRRACNQAARLARCRYLFFLNPDTFFVNANAVDQLAAVLDRDPGVGIVGPMLRGDDGLLAPQGEPLAGLRTLVAGKSGLDRIWPRNPLRRRRPPAAIRHESGPVETVTAAALLCRREDFLAVGGFDERTRMYWEEHELARKFGQRGLTAYYLPEAFVFHHWRKGGSELDPAVMAYFDDAERLYYETFFGRVGRALYRTLSLARGAIRSALRRSA